jgi:type III restriction enzyme
MTEIRPLHKRLIEELGTRTIERTPIPEVILNNLTPRYPLRSYQQRSLQFFLNYWEESFEGKPRQNHQLLFHMATGSGKTLIMAGLILYLYKKGYRNFLFFVNSTNIIEKTRDNFLNQYSKKYFFAETISSADDKITIREISNFQAGNPNDINVVFTTIHGLHLRLNAPGENSITYDDFDDKKIVLISDEAHHINATTKKGKNSSTQEELFEILSWENTVEKIFRANPANVLLEFTATVDFTDENLSAKYKPKLIFDYPLKDFRRDGYSKEVKVVQADLPPFERAIQAVLLSQYRRKVFEKYRKHIKPVILFKSKTIKESQGFLEAFKDGIRGLTARSLRNLESRTVDETLKRMFDYFKSNGISLENLASEIKGDFSEEKLISVNSKDESEAKQLAVNSLEDENNEYRAVFAVDKLNEGWDVLNLFDIVRLYDTRDSKAGKIGKTTMSEAQLIGRGARYCPFQITSDQPLCERKYDADLGHDLRICEELYYHSAYNPKYIQELNTALQELGIKAKETRQKRLYLKDSFKKTPVFKAGHVFLNARKKYNRADVDGLDNSIIEQRHKVSLRTGYIKSSVAFGSAEPENAGPDLTIKNFDLRSFGAPIVRKAIQRLEFYEFANLRHYLPNLKSIDEFIASDRYLGKIRLEVSGRTEQVENLSPDEKLDAAVVVLDRIAEVIASDKVEFKGTTRFEPFMVKETFTDKTLNFVLDDEGDREYGKSMSEPLETAHHLDLTKRDWYVFNDCFGTSEEKLLVQFIEKQHARLREKYDQVYLLRNEKHFKLYNFDDGRPLEPDFVLYLIGKEKKNTMHYQVFIEPKGSHLLKADEWKEKFLMQIQEKHAVEQLFADKTYVIWGLPFYNSEERESRFTEALESLIST